MKPCKELVSARDAEHVPTGGNVEVIETMGGSVPATAKDFAVVAQVVNEIMRPLMESIGRLLKNNTEAMEQIATSQDLIRNRMEALEKQVRLQTPVTDRQARYLADAARDKAKELIEKKANGLSSDKKAVNKLAGMIKKTVLARYGIGTLREIPRVEYNVAMSQIQTWSNAMAVFEIVKEAKERAEVQHEV